MRRTVRTSKLFLMGLLWVAAHGCYALPTDFGDKVEAALLCRSEGSTSYWQAYFSKHLQKPLRDWGQARWWNSQGANLGGVNTTEVFMNLDSSVALMVGVLIPQPVEDARKTIQQNTGAHFDPVSTPDGVRYVSADASVLVGLADKQNTKWYCARWSLGNRP